MASSAPMNIASTIQSASINRHPSPHHDVNPSTTVSSKEPVTISSPPISRSPSSLSPNRSRIPSSTIHPVPRQSNLPPLPDLRFEQSYLTSLNGSTDWKTVGYITVRDQFVLPLVQGMLWTLALSAWRYWNRNAQFSGRSLGSTIRRWWWGVNNWEIPEVKNEQLASAAGQFYKEQFASSGSD